VWVKVAVMDANETPQATAKDVGIEERTESLVSLEVEREIRIDNPGDVVCPRVVERGYEHQGQVRAYQTL
jgi:hypothetical protein